MKKIMILLFIASSITMYAQSFTSTISSLIAFHSQLNVPSEAQQFEITATGITNKIVINSDSSGSSDCRYEVSFSLTSGWNDTIEYQPTTHTDTRTIYVRYIPLNEPASNTDHLRRIYIASAGISKKSSYVAGTTAPAGITETLLTDESVFVYPSPAIDQITIKSSNGINNVTVKDVRGQLLLKEALDTRMDQTVIPLSELANGIYFVQVNTGTGQATKKILVHK